MSPDTVGSFTCGAVALQPMIGQNGLGLLFAIIQSVFLYVGAIISNFGQVFRLSSVPLEKARRSMEPL